MIFFVPLWMLPFYAFGWFLILPFRILWWAAIALARLLADQETRGYDRYTRE